MIDRLSRSERRLQQREDEKLLPQPLGLSSDPRSMMAHVRHVTRLLNGSGKSPCSEAIAHITAVQDRTVPRAAWKDIACQRGCSHCCTQFVTVSAPEALFVAAQIRNRMKTVAAVREAAEKTRGMTQTDRLTAGIWCPLLNDTVCSIYAARPIACHGFVSLSLNACIAAFRDGQPPEIPSYNDHATVMHGARIILCASLRLRGLSDTGYEMNAAVAAALAHDDAEAQWLSGVDIFKGVQTTGGIPPHVEYTIAQLVAHTAPTI